MSRTTDSGPLSAARRLLGLEPLWLLLIAPLLLLPGRFLPIRWHWAVVLSAFLFWPLRLLSERRLSLRSPVTIATGLLLLCFPLPVWIAVDRARAWEVAGYLLWGIVLANALLLWPRVQRSPAWIAAGVLAFALGLSLAGPLIITQAGWAAPVLEPLQRAAGPLTGLLGETINPNILAHGLIMSAPLAIALALFAGWPGAQPRPWLRALAGVLAIWLVVVIVLTQSRGSLLALIVIVPLLVMLRWPRLFWLAPLLGVVAAVLLVWQGPSLLELVTTSSPGGATSGIAERVEIWQRALWLIADTPFTGMGLGAFDRVVPLLYPYILVAPTVEIPNAHNLPLQVAADLGIPGLLAWLAVQLSLLVLLVRLLRTRAAPLVRALAAGTLAAFVAMWVAGIFDAVNWGSKLSFLPWVLAALALLLDVRAQAASHPSGGPVLYYADGVSHSSAPD